MSGDPGFDAWPFNEDGKSEAYYKGRIKDLEDRLGEAMANLTKSQEHLFSTCMQLDSAEEKIEKMRELLVQVAKEGSLHRAEVAYAVGCIPVNLKLEISKTVHVDIATIYRLKRREDIHGFIRDSLSKSLDVNDIDEWEIEYLDTDNTWEDV